MSNLTKFLDAEVGRILEELGVNTVEEALEIVRKDLQELEQEEGNGRQGKKQDSQ